MLASKDVIFQKSDNMKILLRRVLVSLTATLLVLIVMLALSVLFSVNDRLVFARNPFLFATCLSTNFVVVFCTLWIIHTIGSLRKPPTQR